MHEWGDLNQSDNAFWLARPSRTKNRQVVELVVAVAFDHARQCFILQARREIGSPRRDQVDCKSALEGVKRDPWVVTHRTVCPPVCHPNPLERCATAAVTHLMEPDIFAMVSEQANMGRKLATSVLQLSDGVCLAKEPECYHHRLRLIFPIHGDSRS